MDECKQAQDFYRKLGSQSKVKYSVALFVFAARVLEFRIRQERILRLDDVSRTYKRQAL